MDEVVTYFFVTTDAPDEGDDYVKIGVSNSPEARLAAVQTGCPFRLKLRAVLIGDTEGQLHDRFAADRLSGEWFLNSDELRCLMDGLKYEPQRLSKTQHDLMHKRIRRAMDRWEARWGSIFSEKYCEAVTRND